MKKYVKTGALAFLLGSVLVLAGCTRSQINYQIAEAIGTDGKYANNEPVETPKMAEERMLLEESESEEASLMEVLSEAERLAQGYNYEEAISVLDTIPLPRAKDERVLEARERYEKGDKNLVSWVEGDIPHLCFPTMRWGRAGIARKRHTPTRRSTRPTRNLWACATSVATGLTSTTTRNRADLKKPS